MHSAFTFHVAYVSEMAGVWEIPWQNLEAVSHRGFAVLQLIQCRTAESESEDLLTRNVWLWLADSRGSASH